MSNQHIEEIIHFLNENNVKNIVQNEDKLVVDNTLTMYLPDYKFAINFIDLYNDSEINKNKLKYNNLHKTIVCSKKDIKLITIFSDEWINKQDIIKSIILNNLNKSPYNIDITKCNIKPIKKNILFEFLKENSLEDINMKNKALASIGLYNENNDLVYVMVIEKIQDGKYNILIKCFKIMYNGSNIFNVVFDSFSNKLNVGDEVYLKLNYRFETNKDIYAGFVFKDNIAPASHYTNDYETRIIIDNVKEYLKDKYSDNLTCWQNMSSNGYDRVWDCGYMEIKYTKE